MIEKLRIKNFKQIQDETIHLTSAVVFIGPNNGGKTTILQAISLFGMAIKVWGEKRENKKVAKKRTGVAINLSDLLNIPITEFRDLWKNFNLRSSEKNSIGKTIQKSIKIEIHATGYTKNEKWETGFEFEYARDSVVYARLTFKDKKQLYEFPEILQKEEIGYLPSTAGLNPEEDKLELGSIFRYIGSGRTANVLRNICYHLYTNDKEKKEWDSFVEEIENLFKMKINPPKYNQNSGLLKMTFNEGQNQAMDLSLTGSGAKQTILLFAYLRAFPNTIHLYDEPDTHLEFIRQSNIYDSLTNLAKKNNSQIIIASHSEKVLERASKKQDKVISVMFGKCNEEKNQRKIIAALSHYGYQEYIVANQRPYILYCEGSTDLDFIKAFCKKLNKKEYCYFLENKVYPYSIGSNDINRTKEHFSALKKYIPNLKAYALFDNLGRELQDIPPDLEMKQWKRREIENYIPIPETLFAYIEKNFSLGKSDFEIILKGKVPPDAYNNPKDSYWKNTKISDELLTSVFEKFFEKLNLPKSTMEKSKFYQLIDYANPDLLDSELSETLDEIFTSFNA